MCFIFEENQAPRGFRLLYWSSRKEGDIDEPYGQGDHQGIIDLKNAANGLLESKDIYRMEVWERTNVFEREIVVEDYHGNEAHLSLKNSRREDE